MSFISDTGTRRLDRRILDEDRLEGTTLPDVLGPPGVWNVVIEGANRAVDEVYIVVAGEWRPVRETKVGWYISEAPLASYWRES